MIDGESSNQDCLVYRLHTKYVASISSPIELHNRQRMGGLRHMSRMIQLLDEKIHLKLCSSDMNVMSMPITDDLIKQ